MVKIDIILLHILDDIIFTFFVICNNIQVLPFSFCYFSDSAFMYLQYSSMLRWMTPPTFSCSLYCIIIIGLMLRLRAKRTVSMSDSLHRMMPIVGFSFDLRSSWSSASR